MSLITLQSYLNENDLRMTIAELGFEKFENKLSELAYANPVSTSDCSADATISGKDTGASESSESSENTDNNENSTSKDNANKNVLKDVTVTAARIFTLQDDSPVTIIVRDGYGENNNSQTMIINLK